MNIPNTINAGTYANDHTGTPLRQAFIWINENNSYIQRYREWCVYISEQFQDVQLYHEAATQITNVNFGTATSVQYSIDNGVTWINYTVPFTTSTNYTRWRASAFTGTKDANIIIKGLLVV